MKRKVDLVYASPDFTVTKVSLENGIAVTSVRFDDSAMTEEGWIEVDKPSGSENGDYVIDF